MTCIVGLVDNGKIYMGGDSAGCAGWNLSIRADQKVFKNNDFIMGFADSFRMGQLLRYSFTPPPYYEEFDLYKYMVTDFVDTARKCFKNGGFAEKDKEVESGGHFLVGFKGRLFRIESDYQVGENQLPFAACGCGQSSALGSLFSTHGIIAPPRDRIRIALEAAERLNAGVRQPFHIEVLGG